MPRARTYNVRFRRGKWWARVFWIDNEGRRRQIERSAPTKVLARDLLHQLLTEVKSSTPPPERITFADLADRYRAHKVFPAEYVGDRKVAGLRDSRLTETRLRMLVDYFGKRLLTAISPATLEGFKRDRLATPVVIDAGKGKPKRKRQRMIATVNRELQLLRAVLYFAQREGYIQTNPFTRVKALISAADEVKRHRILSRQEESKLLAVCSGRRDYLRRIIICAVDSALRKGELVALTWNDVDLKARRIRVRAVTTKTLAERVVPITARMAFELRAMLRHSPPPGSSVFGVTDYKKGFAAACKDAGIEGLRFHDLRATAITRMLQAGIPAQFVQRISGHTQVSTFQRYVRTGDQEIIDQVLAALDAQAARGAKLTG